MQNKKKRIFNLNKRELYFVIGFFIFIAALLVFTFYSPNYNGTNSSKKIVVKKGSSLNKVIEDLFQEKIIPDKLQMKVAAFIFGIDKNIKAGRYEIPDGISYMELLSLLEKGMPKKQKLITIQEGIWQIDLAKLLENELGLDAKKFMELSKDKKYIKELGLKAKNLEGYLLPETYYFYENCSEKEVIEKLVEEMNDFFESSTVKRQMQILKMTQKQILTMASIIDGESNQVDEFKRIAGVYYNRLKKSWKLQADPTVQYLVRQRRRKVNKIYYKDLEIDSRYNTYKYYGLPPTPINNPGIDAIKAALDPEKHNYFYFVADGTGGHIFSKTSREHQNNVRRYRNWRRKNR
ncbi:MAG: hypothetical protein CR986_00085 [Ignavibacteriae bacterium]|nr:MAG: hypothetical protein CR986_00085 [Ignavibacteriota bacterium]